MLLTIIVSCLLSGLSANSVYVNKREAVKLDCNPGSAPVSACGFSVKCECCEMPPARDITFRQCEGNLNEYVDSKEPRFALGRDTGVSNDVESSIVKREQANDIEGAIRNENDPEEDQGGCILRSVTLIWTPLGAHQPQTSEQCIPGNIATQLKKIDEFTAGQCEVEFGTEIFTKCTADADATGDVPYSYLVKVAPGTEADVADAVFDMYKEKFPNSDEAKSPKCKASKKAGVVICEI